MASIDVNGSTFEYFEEGDGETLVLVHGSASDYRVWESQFDDFSGDYRTIRYSRRYHWPNRQISEGEEYSMPEQLEDLEALIRSFDAAPAHLVSHSYGSFLCLLLAIKEPSLVRSLVLSEPPVITLFVSNTPKPMEILKLLVTRPRTAFSIIGFGVKGLEPAKKAFKKDDMESGIRLFGDAVFGKGSFDNLPGPLKLQVRDNLPNVKAELIGPGFVPLDAEEVRGVRAPALLINGENSIGLFHRLTDRLEELLPHAGRTYIPEASHAMHLDNVPAYNKTVRSFLKENRSAA